METSVRLIWCRRPNRGSGIIAPRLFCSSVCSLLQTEVLVVVHHCMSACAQTANETWITVPKIWIIWIKPIPPTFSSASLLKCLAVIFYESLWSFCLTVFFPLLSRSKGGSAEEKKGAGEGRAADFRPDVAYNLLHTLFYGLLAFSTMRWAHALLIVVSSTCRCLDSHTLPSSHIFTQGLLKCTFPLDDLIMKAHEQMLKP